MKKTRGADLLVQTLAAAGVTKIFSLSGNQIMPLYDACIDAGIEIIHTRHEAAAVFMAIAWAQLTGQLGVCMVTAAPGAANALGPLFSARRAECPVLFLTGDSAIAQDGKGAFQELDQVPMTAPLTKLSFRARSAKRMGHDIARAIRTALSGRPGPVHVALPFDVVQADAGGAELPEQSALRAEPAALRPVDVTRIARILAAAKQPLIVCGPLMSATRQGGALAALADAMDAPVVAMESPRGLKDPSLGEFSRVLAKADVVLSLGKPIDYTLGFGSTAVCDEKCKWIVVDAETGERRRARLNLGKRLRFAFAADPVTAAAALCEAGTGGVERSGWRDEVNKLLAARSLPPASGACAGKITPAQLSAAIQRQLAAASESVLIIDGGEFGQWAQAGTSGTYRLINGTSGAIGGSLCFGVAARKAKPDAMIVAVMGDGTVGFHFAEFETAVREKTPFVVVIGNDACWNAEHQIQLRDYGPERLIGCTLSGARYDLAVEGLGGHGEYVAAPADLDAALGRAVRSGKVACVNVAIEGWPAPSGAAH
ncbi:MAG: thiamine pyrophosphate-binding protein [Burkholderiales bacterium]|nr:thiamine pyrophosphate-binding protein [Burkholderiales bacterium]